MGERGLGARPARTHPPSPAGPPFPGLIPARVGRPRADLPDRGPAAVRRIRRGFGGYTPPHLR
jgi:hypothetical protein